VSDKRYRYMVVFNGRDIRKFETEDEAKDFVSRNESSNPGTYAIEEIR
jgi:hypothetical protein